MISDAPAGAAHVRTEAQALANAAEAAGKAPSIHHTQPWRWSLAGDELDLFVDYRRGLEVTDIEARFAVLSCGAALHRAVVSLTADGLHAVVVRLPNRAHPGYLAQVHIGHQIPVVGTVRHRQTVGPRYASRRPDLGTGIDGDTVWSITAAVQSTGTRLHLLRPAQVFELGVAADNAQRTAAGKAAWRVEPGYWTGGGRPLDGSIPDAASPATTPGHYGDPLTSQAHGHAAVIAILCGSEDSTLAWLRAGEALSAAWLTATELAVSVMPLSATIEIAITREKMRRLLSGLGHPYLVLRLGAIEPVDTTEPDTPRACPETAVKRPANTCNASSWCTPCRPRPGHAGASSGRRRMNMGEPVYVDKAKVITQLRSRQLHARADWVDRELPERIDTHKNSALLKMLGIDLDAMPPADIVASRS